ncbi:hypothetical protein [Methanobacterium sp.]|uniref:hypothetical protein n=1 Tax=Methanobacterium sp. TaxID=2164 RepID=UPI002ABCA95C|nr:hypothetical protein [Methanobacterium sp.]MDY9922770.1 hypothetical protein [Methanobacterium sp.]
MMASDQVKRESRSVNFLLWKYKTKQPGEINPVNIDLKKEWRENQKIRTALTQIDDLKITGDLQKQVLWILTEGPGTKALCGRCKFETVTLAVIFYVKFSNSKKRPLKDYRLARELGLTEEVYSNILTKLGRFFQKKMALNSRIKKYNEF